MKRKPDSKVKNRIGSAPPPVQNHLKTGLEQGARARQVELLTKDNDLLMLKVEELRDSLSSVRQMLTDQTRETNASTELLRLHLNTLQDELRINRLEQQNCAAVFAQEKDMLLQQNNQLQEQLEIYLTKYREASSAVHTLSSFAAITPRLQLLRRANQSATQ